MKCLSRQKSSLRPVSENLPDTFDARQNGCSADKKLVSLKYINEFDYNSDPNDIYGATSVFIFLSMVGLIGATTTYIFVRLIGWAVIGFMP
jgi:hypothetical protein